MSHEPGAKSSSAEFHAVLNVANGKDHTVLELVEMINKFLGKNVAPQLLPIRAGDVFRTCADMSKIKTVIGFNPKVDFAEGLKRTVEWFKQAHRS
jgi:nucleoside-diphosphate-sugar epimerase